MLDGGGNNNYIYVCIKIQFNWQASKLNANGLCVVAVSSAMWRGSPPSPDGKNKEDYSSAGMWQAPQRSETRVHLCCEQ